MVSSRELAATYPLFEIKDVVLRIDALFRYSVPGIAAKHSVFRAESTEASLVQIDVYNIRVTHDWYFEVLFGK